MAKPDHTNDDAPSLKDLFRFPKAQSPRTPSLTRGVAILSLCISIFLFLAFVPSRPGASHSGRYILGFIAAVWTGRGIGEIISARVAKKHHSRKRPNQSLEPTAGRRDVQN
jgi:hypothetical protein